GIVSALQSLNNHIRPDVILLARGGGSIEDLWAFNDERVARAIANCSCPVISGVGHETDFTIADFVADLRAPTPTAAAELATPNRADLITDIEDLAERMNRAVEIVLDNERWRLSRIENRLSLRSPQAQIRSGRQRLDDLLRRSHTLSAHRLQLQRTRLQALQQRLASLSPTAILQRGYAMVTLPDGRIVRSTRQVAYGTDIRIHVEDGSFGARVSDHTPDAQ